MVPMSAAPSRYESSLEEASGFGAKPGLEFAAEFKPPLALDAGLVLPPCVVITTTIAIAAMTARAAPPMISSRLLDPPPVVAPPLTAVAALGAVTLVLALVGAVAAAVVADSGLVPAADAAPSLDSISASTLSISLRVR